MKFFVEKTETPPKEKVLDIKTLLKLARQYIDEKNMKKAQQCCKKVLRKNHQNYMALVFLGKTYGDTDDALLSYEKAVKLKPDHLLAWQGLVDYYEGREDVSAKTKLVDVYHKILTLHIEKDYAIKTLKKYGELGCLLKNNKTISSFIHYIRVQDDEQLKQMAKTQVLQLLKSKVTCKNEDIPAVIEIYKNINSNDLSVDGSALITLGKLILYSRDYKSAVKEIMTLEVFPKSVIMRKWLCKKLCKTFIEKDYFCEFDIDGHINELTLEIEDAKYGKFLFAIMYYRQNMFHKAYKKCLTLFTDPFDLDQAEAKFVLYCCQKLQNPTGTKNLCSYLLRKPSINNGVFAKTLNLTLLTCHMELKNVYSSIYCLPQIPIAEINCITLSEITHLYCETTTQDNILFTTIARSDYLDLFKALACLKKNKFTEAIEILVSYDKHPLKYYYLGQAYWFSKLFEPALENFNKTVELIPDLPKVYYFLGFYYYYEKKDIGESRKYYEKSYSLCKTDLDVIRMLSFTYVMLNLQDLEYDLLKTTFDNLPTNEFWVCKRLGRICYKRGNMDEALTYLQIAKNLNPTDVDIHENMADVYFDKEDYDQALVTYKLVISLNRNPEILNKCCNRIGKIYADKTLYDDAIELFEKILLYYPANVEALQNVTKTRITIAHKHIARDLFEDAREEMQIAFNRITTAMSMGTTDLAYWHLYGDVLVYMSRLPGNNSYVQLQNSESENRKTKIDMYKMAIESYSNVVKVKDSCALFKCALVYFEYYIEIKDLALCQTSYNLAVLCMKVNPNVWIIWDLLGKISFHLQKREQAYYSFSKALCLCEDNDTKIWCDLGMFYIKQDIQQLTSYKHIIGRFDLPPSTPDWLREELADALRNYDRNPQVHVAEPLYLGEMDTIELTRWLHTIIQPLSARSNEPVFEFPIESLQNIPNASEIIEWYLGFEEESVWSVCYLGNLHEKKGMFRTALQHYDRAYTLAGDRLKNEILSYKGRVLMKMDAYEEAVNVYNEIHDKNLKDTCAFAHALYKTEDYNKSSETYDHALDHLCINDQQRMDVIIAKSNVEYRLNGLRNGASLLYQAVEIKYGQGKDFDLTFLKLYAFQNVDIQLVAHIMSEYLHKNMDKTTWWYYMSINYLRGTDKYAKLTRACIKRAIRVNTDSRKNGKLYALLSIAEFYAGNRRIALIYCKRAITLFPAQPELWAVLIFCIFMDRTIPNRREFMRQVINSIRQLMSPVSQSMDQWLAEIEEETNRLN